METILNMKVKTGKKNFRIGFDKENYCLIVETTKRPIEGKANQEIEKNLKWFFKAETTIIKGLKSKEKTIKVSLPQKEVFEKLQAN